MRITGIASLLNFYNEYPFQKTNLFFGTNGSGKSTLVGLLRHVDEFKADTKPDASQHLKTFIRERHSKEALAQSPSLTLEFTSDRLHLTYTRETDSLDLLEDGGSAIRVFDEFYTNRTVGPSISVDLRESGITIGETNRDLETARNKQKNLREQLQRHYETADSIVERKVSEFRDTTNSTMNISARINRNVLLADVCTLDHDKSLIQQRNELGYESNQRPLQTLDLPRASIPLDIESVIERCREIVPSPEVSPELETYLRKYDEFYQQGINVIESENLNDECPYCHQSWPDAKSRIDEYKTFLQSEYSSKRVVINDAIDTLENYKTQIKSFNKTVDERYQSVANEAAKYKVDIADWQSIIYDQTSHDQVVSLLKQKYDEMDREVDIAEPLYTLQRSHQEIVEKNNKVIENVNANIESITSLRKSLNQRLADHFGWKMWSENEALRQKIRKTEELIQNNAAEIERLELESPPSETVRTVFNRLLQEIGLAEYSLDSERKLNLTLDQSYDISQEGNRISSAQRKIIAFCYFFAEMVSEVDRAIDLGRYIVVFDDPVDSADYVYFYSIANAIENIESMLSAIIDEDIHFGQFFVFTHNALLFERLAARWQNYRKAIAKRNNATVIEDVDKTINNYFEYISVICRYFQNPRAVKANRIFVGNVIRRVLEILSNFENLGSNDVQTIIDGTGKQRLSMIANHMSHETFAKVIDPLSSTEELQAACREVLELIKDRHYPQYQTIQEKFGVEI